MEHAYGAQSCPHPRLFPEILALVWEGSCRHTHLGPWLQFSQGQQLNEVGSLEKGQSTRWPLDPVALF